MIPLSIKKIAEATGGKFKYKYRGIKVTSVEIDTRNELEEGLFIALKGESFDGHDFINQAFGKGAVCVMTERDIDIDMPVIQVESTYQALKDLAKYYRSLFDIPVIGVTGSVGKTTTKDLIASVLATKYRTLKTEGNFNNEIGLPLTVFRLDESYQAAVFEMGMNHFGEIHNLADIARPNICVITNIGVTHIENLGSQEGVLKAKSEIFDFLPSDGDIILNGEDPMLIGLKDKLKDKFRNIKYFGTNGFGTNGFGSNEFGTNENFFYKASSINNEGLCGVFCRMQFAENSFNALIPLPGQHMVLNGLAAAAVGHTLNIDATSIKNGIENFRPSKMRMDIENIQGGITLINDSYNSSPTSVAAALNVLNVVKGRKISILGDMFELGKAAESFHYDVGIQAAIHNIDILIFVGSLSKHMYKGAMSVKNEYQTVIHFETKDELAEHLFDILKDGDTVLIKASRGMHLEDTVKILKRGAKHE